MIYNIGDEVRITWNEKLFKDEIGIITALEERSTGIIYRVKFISEHKWSDLYTGPTFNLSEMSEDGRYCNCSDNNIKLYNKAKRTYIPTKKRFGIVAFTKDYYK